MNGYLVLLRAGEGQKGGKERCWPPYLIMPWLSNVLLKQGTSPTLYVTHHNKRYNLSTLNKIRFLHYLRFYRLSNDTKCVKIELILLKVQLLQSVYFILFYLYFTHYCVHYLRMNLADKMYNFDLDFTFICYNYIAYNIPAK